MLVINSKKKLTVAVLFLLFLILYYQLDYKRHFVYSTDKTEVITIWSRLGNNTYIIPYKYFSLFSPKINYIKTKTHRNYLNIVWDTGNKNNFVINTYQENEQYQVDRDIIIYEDEEKFYDHFGVKKNSSKDVLDSIKKKLDYMYVDLNRIYGIKVFKWNAADQSYSKHDESER